VVVVNLRPSSRISKASEAEPLLTLTLLPSAKRQATTLVCLHAFTSQLLLLQSQQQQLCTQKKTAKTSPQILRTTATSNTVFIMRHKRVPFGSVPHQKFNLHMRCSKSPSNNAQLKNRVEVVGIRRTNSLLQKLHETQRTRRIHRCAFNEEAGSDCNLFSSVYCNRLPPRKTTTTTTTTTKFTDSKTSLPEDKEKKQARKILLDCLLASPSFLACFLPFLVPGSKYELATKPRKEGMELARGGKGR
jgi:hypothetical protein